MLEAGCRGWLLGGAVCAAVSLGVTGARAAGPSAGPVRTLADGPRAALVVSALAGGGFAGYALLSSGRVLAWGDDLEGQIGPAGVWQASAVPVAVPRVSAVTAIAAGDNTGYALESDGSVWAWGDDSQDELGDTGVAAQEFPRRVAVPAGVVAIAAGAFSAYVLRRDGKVWAWGDNDDDQLGSEQQAFERGRPRPVQRLTGVIAVAAGLDDGYALRADGTVWVWGDGSIGQLGVGRCRGTGPGTCPETAIPVQVRGLRDVVAIAAGADTGYALASDGTVWAWGDNGFGELGISSRRSRSAVPIRVKGLQRVVAIAAGAYTGYALLGDGAVWAWGRGVDGELGAGRAVNDPTARPVDKLDEVTKIAAGGVAGYALERDGSVWAWGSGDYGQLGDGYLVSLDEPTPVLIEN